MNELISISNIITVLVALLGWLVVHNLTKTREIETERRNIRAHYLLVTYRSVENSICRNLQDDDKRKLENAIAEVELFGNKEQIDLAQEIAKNSIGNSMDEKELVLIKLSLLDSLRQELRDVFKQEQVKLTNRVVLRFEQKN